MTPPETPISDGQDVSEAELEANVGRHDRKRLGPNGLDRPGPLARQTYDGQVVTAGTSLRVETLVYSRWWEEVTR
jgi:hypothetical protein